MAGTKIGEQQRYLLNEIRASAEEWVEVGSKVCGSNYGGLKKHEAMVESLRSRGHLKVRQDSGITFAKFISSPEE